MKFVGDVMDRNHEVITFIMRRPRVANLQPCFFKQPQKSCIKMQSISVFPDITKVTYFR